MKQEKLEQLLEMSISWAITLHAGQTYAFGDDYYLAYVKEVEKTVWELTRGASWTNTDRFLAAIVANLHDVPVNTQATIEEIRKTFGRRIAEMVLNLTKMVGEQPESQWSRATRDPISMVVKKAAMLVNLRTSLANNRLDLIDKYLKGLDFLCFKSNC